MSLLVYQLTLVTFLSYYVTSRFANIYIKELFYMFLVSRPIVIATYTTFSACCSIKNARYITRTLKREKLAERADRIARRAKARQSELSSDSDDVDVAFGRTDKKRKAMMNIEEQIQYENPDIPQCAELLWNFILQPVIIYGGLGRLVIVSEKKKTF